MILLMLGERWVSRRRKDGFEESDGILPSVGGGGKRGGRHHADQDH